MQNIRGPQFLYINFKLQAKNGEVGATQNFYTSNQNNQAV